MMVDGAGEIPVGKDLAHLASLLKCDLNFQGESSSQQNRPSHREKTEGGDDAGGG